MIVPEQPLANGTAHHIQEPSLLATMPVYTDTTILDLEEPEAPAPVHMNGYGPISDISSTVAAYRNTLEQNGGLFGGPTLPAPQRPSREAIRNMYAQVDRYPMDSNI